MTERIRNARLHYQLLIKRDELEAEYWALGARTGAARRSEIVNLLAAMGLSSPA